MAWTKGQRNEVFHVLREGGLDPVEWDLAEDRDSLTLKYLPNGESVRFLIRQGHRDTLLTRMHLTWYDLSCNPPHREVRNPERPDGQWRWPGVIRVLTEWARDFHFRTTPDQWEQNALRRQLVKVDDPSGGDNTPFTEAERAEIAAQLRAIEADLREQGKLTEGIKAALGEAREASNRLGRKDWKNWFLGTVTALLVAGNVDRDVANHVLVFILRGLAHLFGHGGPPPMLGH